MWPFETRKAGRLARGGDALAAAPWRRRSPGWRRRSALVLLVLVGVGLGGYWRLTSQSRLISVAQTFLRSLSGGEATIRSARFSFFGGIHLSGVTLRVPDRLPFGPPDAEGRIVFVADDLYLQHEPLLLLLGRFEVRGITATRPEFRFVRQKGSDLSNWQVMLSARPGKRGGRIQWPLLRLNQCTIRTGTLKGPKVVWAEPLEVDLRAVPSADRPGLYQCRLRPLGEDVRERDFEADLVTGQVRGELEELRISISQLRPSLPPEYQRWCEILELTGQIRAENIEYDPSQAGKYAVNLSEVSLSVPLDESEFYGEQARARRLIRLQGVTGRIVFEPSTVQFDLRGTLNGAPCSVEGEISDYLGPLAAVGLDIRIQAQQLLLPDRRDPHTARQIAKLGGKVARFFELFDPSGRIDIRGRVTKPAGPGQPVRFRGTLSARDARARYKGFPYQGEHVSGTVRFTDDGIFFDVLGSRREALVRVKGWLAEPTRQTDADLSIEAAGVPLDDHLYRALPAAFRKLWDSFDLFGLISGKFRIWRQGGSVQKGPAPWRWTARIEVDDVAARYKNFNYLQTGLSGRIEASDGLVSDIDLYASRLDGLVRITGAAELRDPHPAVNLRIVVANLPFGPDLVHALPERIQRLFERVHLSGAFDAEVNLRCSSHTGGRLECRATVDWRCGAIVLKSGPYPFYDLRGRLRVDVPANRIDILQITGSNGPASMQISGYVRTEPHLAGRLRLSVDGLPLDDRLYMALPASYQRWWQDLQPDGSLGFRSDVVLGEAGGDLSLSHETSLLLHENRICWKAFPLPLDGVTGEVTIAGDRLEIRRVTGKHAGGRVALSGTVSTRSRELSADLQLTARDLPLDESLRLAVPWRLRKLWNDIRPVGRIDVDFNRVQYGKRSDGNAQWRFAGTVVGRLKHLSLAVPVKDAVVRISGRAEVDEGRSGLRGAGRLRIVEANIGALPVADVDAQWRQDASGALQLDKIRGRSAGGILDGFFELYPTRQGRRYGLILRLDRADLRQLAEAIGAGVPDDLAGSVRGQLRLGGLVGLPSTRSGSGEAIIFGRGLYRLPVLLQIAELLNVPTSPSKRRAQRAGAKLSISGSRIVIDSLELRDASLWMLGSGKVELPQRRLDLTIVAARPRSWPTLPFLTELLQGTLRELIEVRATGPLDDLRFEARPLRSVQSAMRILLSRRPPD